MNIQQENRAVNSLLVRVVEAESLGNVSNGVSEGLFYGRMVAVGVLPSFHAGGQVKIPAGADRSMRNAPAGIEARRAARCGVLHSSRINFRSEKVCRSEKNVMAAKTALAVQPGGGRRLFAVHAPVVSRCQAPLMFKYSPGVRLSVVVLSYGPFLVGGLCG